MECDITKIKRKERFQKKEVASSKTYNMSLNPALKKPLVMALSVAQAKMKQVTKIEEYIAHDKIKRVLFLP